MLSSLRLIPNYNTIIKLQLPKHNAIKQVTRTQLPNLILDLTTNPKTFGILGLTNMTQEYWINLNMIKILPLPFTWSYIKRIGACVFKLTKNWFYDTPFLEPPTKKSTQTGPKIAWKYKNWCFKNQTGWSNSL